LYTMALRDSSFFARVDKLKAYKEQRGHLKVRDKKVKALSFCYNVRQSR
jgi:hypothetical protein